MVVTKLVSASTVYSEKMRCSHEVVSSLRAVDQLRGGLALGRAPVAGGRARHVAGEEHGIRVEVHLILEVAGRVIETDESAATGITR
jgi:hypothetical protein